MSSGIHEQSCYVRSFQGMDMCILQEAARVNVDPQMLLESSAVFDQRAKIVRDNLQEETADGILANILHGLGVAQKMGLTDEVKAAACALQRRCNHAQCTLLSAAQQCCAQLKCGIVRIAQQEVHSLSATSDRVTGSPQLDWHAWTWLAQRIQHLVDSFSVMQQSTQQGTLSVTQETMAAVSQSEATDGNGLSAAVLDMLIAAQETTRLQMAPHAQAATEAVLSLLRYGQACMHRAGVYETVLCTYFGQVQEAKASCMQQRPAVQPSADLITLFFESVLSQCRIAARPLCTRAALRIAALDTFCASSIRRHDICNPSAVEALSQASGCMLSQVRQSGADTRQAASSSAGSVRCFSDLPSGGLAACSGASAFPASNCIGRCTLVYDHTLMNISVPPMPFQ
jgi:hypothetical protein